MLSLLSVVESAELRLVTTDVSEEREALICETDTETLVPVLIVVDRLELIWETDVLVLLARVLTAETVVFVVERLALIWETDVEMPGDPPPEAGPGGSSGSPVCCTCAVAMTSTYSLTGIRVSETYAFTSPVRAH